MRMLWLVVVCATVVVFGSSVSAQEPGDIGIFLDAEGTISSRAVEIGGPISLYVVAFEVPENIQLVEFGIGGLHHPAVELTHAFPPLDGGWILFQDSLHNFHVFFPECLPSTGPLLLLELQVSVLDPDIVDLPICIRPFSPAVPHVPWPAPAYRRCDVPDYLYFFGVAQSGGGVYPNACAIINPTNAQFPIAAEARSWSSVKAAY